MTKRNLVKRCVSVIMSAGVAGSVLAVVVTTMAPQAASGATIPPNDLYVVNTTCANLTAYPQGTLHPSATGSTPVGAAPQYVALTPDGTTALVTNSASNTVTMVDVTSGTPLATVLVGGQPEGIAVAPSGTTAYVVDSGSHDIRAIDVGGRSAGAGTVAGVSPYGIAITPNGKTAYVSDSGSALVTPFSLPSMNSGAPIAVGANPEGIAVTPDGSTVFVADSGTNTVTPISTTTNVPGTPITVGSNPTNIAVSPDGTTAVVTNSAPGGTPTLSVINVAADSVAQTIVLPAGDVPNGVTWAPDDKAVWVTSSSANALIPLTVSASSGGDALTLAPVVNEASPCAPVGIVAAPDQTPRAQLATTSYSLGVGGGTVTLDATPSTVDYGQIALYGWIFGDGTSAQVTAQNGGATVTHSYTKPGTYVATVVEVDSAGTGPSSVFTGQTMSRYAAAPLGQAQDIAQAIVTVAAATSTGNPIPPNDPVLFAAEAGSGSVQPVGLPATASPSATPPAAAGVTLGGEPGFDAVTPDGHVTVVTNFANSTVVPVVTCQSGSPPTDTFAPGTAVRAGRNPTEVAILPTPVSQTATQVQWLAYVTDYGASDVRAYVLTESTSSCGASLSQVAAFPASSISANQAAVNAQPYGIAITPNGQTAYVSDYGLNAVTPINLGTGQVGNPIPVGMNPEGIAVTPDGATVYVVNSGSGTITPIATSSNLPGLPIAVGSSPTMIAITDDGARALVTNAGSDSVTDILLQSCGTTGSCASSATTSLGLASPTGVAVSADGSTAWVASCNGDDIFPISLGGSPSADAIDTAGLVQGVACPVGIAITPDQAPVAQLAQTTISTTTGAAAFDASPSTVAYGQITLYGWIFGDGTETQTSGPLATHTYSAPGTYVVTVIEVDGAGTALTSAFTGQTLSRYAALKGNGLKEDVVQAVVTVGGVTGGGGNGGGPIPITGVSGLLYTANVNAGTVTPIGLPNSGAPDVGASITVGKGPANVAVTPDGQGLVVPNFSANTVSPVSVCANTTSGTFSFTAGTAVTTTSSEPLDVAFAPSPVSTSGPTTVWNFYVTEYGGSIVEQFQLTVNSATCTAAVNRVSPYSASLIPVGQAPYGIAISPNGATAYVSNSGSATVTPISLNAGAVGGQTGAPIPVGRNPEGIAMSSSGTVVVADSGSGAVTVINTSNNTPGPPITVGSSPDYVAVTPNGSWAYVTNVGSGTVSAVNLASCTPASCQVLTIGLPSVGYGVVMSPDGTTAWVACPGAGEVVPISVATNSIASDVIAGLNGPLGVAEGAAP